jgi:putative NIF3 family GTP cyclohydrolase 1 type 2
MEGYYCGRIGEFPSELDFEELVKRMEETCEEPVTFWNNRKTQVRKIAVTTGGGSLTDLVREAADLGCDTYITGERNLYLAEYAEFLGINLITGSHTFTEIQGVESLARLIGEKFGIETVRIQEPHLESRKDVI